MATRANGEPSLRPDSEAQYTTRDAAEAFLRENQKLFFHSGSWYEFDPQDFSWKEFSQQHIFRRVMDTFDRLKETFNSPEAKAKGFRSYWRKNCKTGEFKRILELAMLLDESRHLNLFPSEQEKRCLNLRNGTYDLSSNSFTASEPATYTPVYAANASYNPDAECPVFEEFIQRMTAKDEKLQKFLQRYSGYLLTGERSKQSFTFLYGPANTGKTLFGRILKDIFDRYVVITSPSSILQHRSGPSKETLDNVYGARLVLVYDLEAREQFNSKFFKDYINLGQTASGGPLRKLPKARPESAEFLFISEELPLCKDTDDDFWRHIQVIPFSEKFSDKELKDYRERCLPAERDGILNWLLGGHWEYQENGLPVPDEVLKATQEYRFSVDLLHNFIEERCEISEGARVSASELRKEYALYASQQGYRALNQHEFTQAMKNKGYESRRSGTNGAYEWHGVGLRYEKSNVCAETQNHNESNQETEESRTANEKKQESLNKNPEELEKRKRGRPKGSKGKNENGLEDSPNLVPSSKSPEYTENTRNTDTPSGNEPIREITPILPRISDTSNQPGSDINSPQVGQVNETGSNELNPQLSAVSQQDQAQDCTVNANASVSSVELEGSRWELV
jgi:putative DNA primase/helicase